MGWERERERGSADSRPTDRPTACPIFKRERQICRETGRGRSQPIRQQLAKATDVAQIIRFTSVLNFIIIFKRVLSKKKSVLFYVTRVDKIGMS